MKKPCGYFAKALINQCTELKCWPLTCPSVVIPVITVYLVSQEPLAFWSAGGRPPADQKVRDSGYEIDVLYAMTK